MTCDRFEILEVLLKVFRNNPKRSKTITDPRLE